MSASEFSAQLENVETSLINRLKPLEMWRPESRDRIEALEVAVMAAQKDLVGLGAKLDSFAGAIERSQVGPSRLDALHDLLRKMQVDLHDLGEHVHSLSVEVAAMRKS